MHAFEHIASLEKQLDVKNTSSRRPEYMREEHEEYLTMKESFKRFYKSKLDISSTVTLAGTGLLDVTMTKKEFLAERLDKECNGIASDLLQTLGPDSLYPLALISAALLTIPAATGRDKYSRGILYVAAATEVLVATYMTFKHYTEFPGLDLC